MLIRSVEAVSDGKSPVFEKDWVPIEEISRNMPQAVVASEDNLFLHHWGFSINDIDKVEIQKDGAAYGMKGANGVIVITTIKK